MINRLIKTEKDNEKVLSRIEQLMNAEPGTAEMDELELLTALVEMYENRHYPPSALPILSQRSNSGWNSSI